MECPICNSRHNGQVKFIISENFDYSYLYRNIRIVRCTRCGHIFNDISKEELINLHKYYEEEYAPINLSATDDTDRPGSETANERYDHMLSFIKKYSDKESRVLDIGCGAGGLIKYLKSKYYVNLYGIDPIEAYVKEAKDENIKVGNVFNIPFDDNSFDIVVLDQVLEHLNDLNKAMKEIHRVLDKGGICVIGVPDVERYDDEIYFYLMREHLQHFKLETIKLLAQNNEFELINYHKSSYHMIGRICLPNIIAVLKKRGDIYCFGIGREFMYLYPNTRLKYLDLILIDDIPEKQNKTFKGMKIHSSEILKTADKDSFVIITAKAHASGIYYKISRLKYKGVILFD